MIRAGTFRSATFSIVALRPNHSTQPVRTGGSFPGIKAIRAEECMELHLQFYYTFLAGHRENVSITNTLRNKLQKIISYSKCARRTKLMNYHRNLKLQH